MDDSGNLYNTQSQRYVVFTSPRWWERAFRRFLNCLCLFGAIYYVSRSNGKCLVFPLETASSKLLPVVFFSPLPFVVQPLNRRASTMPSLNMILPLILSLLPLIQAHDNGMDMSMDGSMGLASGQMLTYLHFTKGDILWFQGWVPGKAGTMFAACFALFLVAVFERWVACLRAVGEHFWRKR